MSFGFGNTTQNAFGAAAKPTGFGAPLSFGTSTATAPAPSGFGGFGSFVAPTQTAPAFGSTFGTPTANPAPAFGSSFGNPTASVAPTFGSSFGTQAAAPFGSTFGTASAAPAFGASFGAPTSSAPSLFGATATSKPSLFGATTAPSLFSTPSSVAPLFGGTTTTQATSLFGANTSAAPNLFGATATATPSLFGTSFGTAATSAPSLFGTTSTTAGGGFGLFGNTTTTSGAPLFSAFGTTGTAPSLGGFGTAGTTNPGFGTFGAANTTGGLFGAKLPGLQPQIPESKEQQTLASFYAINVFGDERDEIIKKWNILQACWGAGKGFYSASQPPVDYDHCNLFYRFKAISYIVIPQTDNSDGLVKLLFTKKESELISQKQGIINGLNGILGNKPNLTVTIIHIKSVSETETEIMITVSEKGVTGTSKIIHSMDLASFLNQPTQKQQLSNVGVTYIGPYIMPSKAQLEEYLKEPPPGIDIHMWLAAQADNPHPDRFLPSPICGFTNLKKRTLCEEYETGLHRAFLVKVNNDIAELKKKHSSSLAQIAEQKQKFLQLQHRVLRILVKQEVTRKVGISLQPEEEMLKARLEVMNSHLNVPCQFRGKINELYSSTKVANMVESARNENYIMDQRVQDDIKQFLQMEQNGITHLIKIINSDLKDLKIISEGLTQIQYKHV